MAFCMCVSLHDGNKHCVEHQDYRNRILTFYVNCRTTPYLSLHSDIVRFSVAIAVASQLSKLWRNDRGSTCKQKTFKRDFGVFLYTPNMRLTQF